MPKTQPPISVEAIPIDQLPLADEFMGLIGAALPLSKIYPNMPPGHVPLNDVITILLVAAKTIAVTDLSRVHLACNLTQAASEALDEFLASQISKNERTIAQAQKAATEQAGGSTNQ